MKGSRSSALIQTYPGTDAEVLHKLAADFEARAHVEMPDAAAYSQTMKDVCDRVIHQGTLKATFRVPAWYVLMSVAQKVQLRTSLREALQAVSPEASPAAITKGADDKYYTMIDEACSADDFVARVQAKIRQSQNRVWQRSVEGKERRELLARLFAAAQRVTTDPAKTCSKVMQHIEAQMFFNSRSADAYRFDMELFILKLQAMFSSKQSHSAHSFLAMVSNKQ
jgi:hypothetical protein